MGGQWPRGGPGSVMAAPGISLGKLATLGWIGVIAVALWLAYGLPYLGYDALFSVVWGADLLGPRPLVFDAPGYPTPHPLANLVTALLAPLRDGAALALELITLVAFAVLGWTTFLLGRRLFSTGVGVVAGLVIVTRPPLVKLVLLGSIDIAFLALVIGAAAAEAAQRRRGAPVLALLFLAGLLRPEGWLLSAAYVLYLARPAGSRRRLALAAAAAAAPLVWLLFDLAVTGDLLHSFHGAREFTERDELAASVGSVVVAVPKNLAGILGMWVLAGSALGVGLALWRARGRAALPIAVAAVGSAAFLALGLGGMPLYSRFLLVPAAALVVFFGVAALAWRLWPGEERPRAAWAPVLAAVLLLVVSLPADAERLSFLRARAAKVRDVQSDLQRLAAYPAFRARQVACPPLQIDNRRGWPLLAHSLETAPSSIVAAEPTAAPRGGLVVRLSRPDPQRDSARDREQAPPQGSRPVYANASWTVYGRCVGR